VWTDFGGQKGRNGVNVKFEGGDVHLVMETRRRMVKTTSMEGWRHWGRGAISFRELEARNPGKERRRKQKGKKKKKKESTSQR